MSVVGVTVGAGRGADVKLVGCGAGVDDASSRSVAVSIGLPCTFLQC